MRLIFIALLCCALLNFNTSLNTVSIRGRPTTGCRRSQSIPFCKRATAFSGWRLSAVWRVTTVCGFRFSIRATRKDWKPAGFWIYSRIKKAIFGLPPKDKASRATGTETSRPIRRTTVWTAIKLYGWTRIRMEFFWLPSAIWFLRGETKHSFHICPRAANRLKIFFNEHEAAQSGIWKIRDCES